MSGFRDAFNRAVYVWLGFMFIAIALLSTIALVMTIGAWGVGLGALLFLPALAVMHWGLDKATEPEKRT